jgi:hypothetical protein
MGKRHQPRTELKVPVRIFGTDSFGRIFSENVETVDVSRDGVQLSGVKAQIALDEIVGITYSQKKIHFRVKWIGVAGTPKAGRIGLLNLTPEKPLWDTTLPENRVDDYRWVSGERRQHPRIKMLLAVELQVERGNNLWANAADLSEGGCFVEMAIPLAAGSKLKIGLWINGSKTWFRGEVASSTPGFGIGIRFTRLSDADLAMLKSFLQAKASS